MTGNDVLEKKIGISFNDNNLLTEALTHRSYLNECADWKLPHNERLEYLGDAVLELVITHELFKKFPDQAEGQLTVLRAALVNAQMLSRIAEDIELGDFLRMSRGEPVPLRPHHRYMVSVGSVGQPRDDNSAASFVMYDEEKHGVVFHRVAYDFAATGAKILAAGLNPFFAERLADGR